MKTSRRVPARITMPSAAGRQEVQREIEMFLRALDSYPDHFAQDPCLSFQQHLFSLSMPPRSVLSTQEPLA